MSRQERAGQVILLGGALIFLGAVRLLFGRWGGEFTDLLGIACLVVGGISLVIGLLVFRGGVNSGGRGGLSEKEVVLDSENGEAEYTELRKG